MKKMPPIIPFSIIYMLTLIAFCWWMIRFNTRRLARKEQRRILMLADTMPPMPALPPSETINCRCAPLIPAWQLDASDTSDDTLAYCPICALEGVRVSGLRDADGYFPLPRGLRVLCSEHTVRWERRIEGDVL